MQYLPEPQNDFIFPIIAEEWGFVGATILLGAFLFWTLLGFRIASSAPDLFGRLLAIGLTGIVALGAFLHMGITMGVLPTTGVSLPFISAGGTGIVVALASPGCCSTSPRNEPPDVSGARILFTGGGTGGHLYPALNIAAAIRLRDPAAECFFVGSRRGIESGVLPESGVPHRLLPLEPIRRARPWRNWRLLATAPAVISGIAAAFRAFRPQVVVGTGGYVSGPALAWARLKGVPIVLQEQNAEPGFVTRLMARHARQVHLGYPEARGRLDVGPATRVFDSGNPVAASLVAGDMTDYAWPEGRVLLVVGGSQGARAVNRALTRDLRRVEAAEWPDDLTVVWVAGRAHATEIEGEVRALPVADRIRVEPFIRDLGRQLDAVDLALSRSGAMLVAELCSAGVPSVLVPLPTAAADHQTVNARALAEAGAAIVRPERDLEPGALWGACLELLEDPGRLAAMSRAARERARPDAASTIAESVLALASAPAASSGAGDP